MGIKSEKHKSFPDIEYKETNIMKLCNEIKNEIMFKSIKKMGKKENPKSTIRARGKKLKK